MNTLYGMFYSPWTQRARWALDHHGVAYRYREHSPFIGEGALNRRARRAGLTGTATVPLLITDSRAVGDSWDIMCYADEVGTAASLGTHTPEVAAFHAAIEPALQSARVRVTRRILASKPALTEAAAAAVPSFMAPLARPVAAVGARHIAKKYGFEAAGKEDHGPLRAALIRIQDQLGDGDYLFDSFGAADIIAACLLNAVRPHGSVPLKAATQGAWHVPELAAEFSNLLAWRDRLHARHR